MKSYHPLLSYKNTGGYFIMMKQVLKKVYTVTRKEDKPRVWLQSLVLEAAGIQEKDPVYISINKDKEEIIVQNEPIGEDDILVHASGRLNKTSNKRRPLLDSARKEYSSIISIKEKVEIIVIKNGSLSQIIIRPLHYQLMESSTITAPKDNRIKVLSIAAGCGIGTAALIDTKAFVPVQEIELEDDSAEVLKHNYPSSLLFVGDLRDVNDVVESDLALITLPCNNFSSLSDQNGSTFDNLIFATAKIILSSKAKVLFFENVPSFFEDNSWFVLKDLIKDSYPFFAQKNIEAWDFKSISTRNRTYCVAFSEEQMFRDFSFPKEPKGRRKKLKEYLDGKHIKHEWKSVEKWMKNFKDRDSSWKDRNLDKTFVTGDCQQINCVPKRYKGQSASSSYVLSDDKKNWRFLSETELRRIFEIPDWFQFCDHTPISRRYEMIGQSVSSQVIKAIGNNIAMTFMKKAFKSLITTSNALNKKVEQAVSMNTNGQLELII